MQLVSQLPNYPSACQQACIAMLAGTSLEEVVKLIGGDRLSYGEKYKACEHFGIKLEEHKLIVSAFPYDKNKTLTQIQREYEGCPLWLSVYDRVDTSYGHATIFFRGSLYDPHHGINPHDWLWSRVISDAHPVLQCPVK